MRIKALVYTIVLLALVSCSSGNKGEIANALGIAEPEKWLLIVHPEGCKTCLDGLYAELMDLPEDALGAIVILAKNSKTLRMNPLIENSPIPLYLDEEKLLIETGMVDLTDQILLLHEDQTQKFDILDYQQVLEKLSRK